MENNNNMWIFAIVLVVLLLLVGGLGMGGYGMMGFGMGFGFIFMILIVGGLIWLVVTLTNASSSKQEERPEDILKRRYAEGQITKKEYEEKKKELR